MQSLEELLGEAPALAALPPEHSRDDRRLRPQPRLRAGRRAPARGRPGRRVLRRSAAARSRSRPPVPGRGAVTLETLSDGRPARLVVARAAVPQRLRRARARRRRTRSRSTAPACAASASAIRRSATTCSRSSRRCSSAASRSTRMRLLDLYARGAAVPAERPLPLPGRRAPRSETARHLDAAPRGGRRRRAGALRARPVRDALRVRRGRGADLGQRDPERGGALVHTVRAVGAVTRALCAARAGDVVGRARPVRQRLAAEAGRGPRRRDRRRRARARAAAPGRPRAARRPRALRRA